MKEIKFRAWDKDNKEMYYGGFQLWFDSQGDLKDNPPIHDRRFIMQYTGLQDKNGKEIYENDVVRYERTFPNSGKPFARKYQHTVKWDYDLEIDGGSSMVRGVGFRDIGEHVEIIGNVYQNPELIK